MIYYDINMAIAKLLSVYINEINIGYLYILLFNNKFHCD